MGNTLSQESHRPVPEFNRSRSRNRISPAPEARDSEERVQRDRMQERDRVGVPPPVPSRSFRSPRLLPPIEPEVLHSTPWEDRKVRKKEAEDIVQKTIDEIENRARQGTFPQGTISDPEIYWKDEEKKRIDYLIGRIKGELGREPFLKEKKTGEMMKECLESIRETVRKMQILEKGIIAQKCFQPEVFVYYRMHKMILASRRYHGLSTSRRMELIHTPPPSREIAEKEETDQQNRCKVCDTVHIGAQKDKLCQQIIDNSGPRVYRYLKQSEAWQEQCEALLIGYHEYRYIPHHFNQLIINCGQLSEKGTYTTGRKSAVDKSTGSLHAQVQRHLDLLQGDARTVFVEYYDSQEQVGVPLQHMMGFLRVIQDLQVSTWSEIVVLTSPYLPVPEDTTAEYQEKAATRLQRNMTLEVVCLAYGVPCFNAPLQAGYEETVPTVYTRNPKWNLEPLTNLQGQVTTELLLRVGLELASWIGFTKVRPIRYPTVEDATMETIHRYHSIPVKYPSRVRYIPALGTYHMLQPRHSF